MGSLDPQRVGTRLGRTLTGAEAAQVALWAKDAELLIRHRMNTLGASEADVDPAVMQSVVELAVTAMARRPNDETEVSVTVDDGSVRRRYESSPGRVAILDEWWELLGLAGDALAGGWSGSLQYRGAP